MKGKTQSGTPKLRQMPQMAGHWAPLQC